MEPRFSIEAQPTSPGERGVGSASARAAAALLPRAVALLPLVALAAACATVAPTSPRQRTVRNQSPPRSLPVPVSGVAPASLRDSFGDPRSGGRRHEGIDIFAAKRTQVVSATEGYVARMANGGLGGITVTVIGPAGWRHYYAHLDAWGPIREGQWVQPGTLLGYVGNSGNARTTPPHLHYGIYPEGRGAINPYPLLRSGPGAPGTVIASTPPRGGQQPGRTTRTNPPRTVPAEVEEAARREAERLGARVLGEILRRAGGGGN
jgi:murein DD-endopeptidase MepM/ murein hydrolase activator NlpD